MIYELFNGYGFELFTTIRIMTISLPNLYI